MEPRFSLRLQFRPMIHRPFWRYRSASQPLDLWSFPISTTRSSNQPISPASQILCRIRAYSGLLRSYPWPCFSLFNPSDSGFSKIQLAQESHFWQDLDVRHLDVLASCVLIASWIDLLSKWLVGDWGEPLSICTSEATLNADQGGGSTSSVMVSSASLLRTSFCVCQLGGTSNTGWSVG